MSNLEDHALGVELQLIELVERRERATVQGRTADAAGFQAQIDALQAELAAFVESETEATRDGGVDLHARRAG
ncbi:MAG TPA: hypothetical protein VFH45_08900 [Acidimicrobiales bacterium]|nr:hypothetical protein [Acidimicrobiales bacterium]